MGWEAVRFKLPLGGGIRIVRLAEGKDSPHLKHIWKPGHWYIHAYNYEAEITIGRDVFPIRPGFVGIIPPRADVTYRWRRPSSHLFAHFSCLDPKSQSVDIPAMQDLGAAFAPLVERFESAIRFFDATPGRAEASLWDLLWDLATPARKPVATWQDVPNPLVRHACQYIEQVMHRNLTVATIAQEVGVTTDHLARLFRQHLRTTVLAYLRRRRVLRAEQLLRHSSLPVKSIAEQVGIPDTHYFNKTIRREFGAAPSRIRETSRG